MKDFRQLVRWALPGFISVALGAILYVIPDAQRGRDLVDVLRGPTSETAVNVVAALVGGLAFVTAAGYVLSMFHHFLLNLVYPASFNADLRTAIRTAGLRVLDYEGRPIQPDHLTVSGAWVVANVAWHANKGPSDSPVAAAEGRSQSMYDIMHGAGATLMGVLVAIIFGVLMGGIDGVSLALDAAVLLGAIANFRILAKRTEVVAGGLLVAVLAGSAPKEIRVDRRFACSRKLRRNSPAVAIPTPPAADSSTSAAASANRPPPRSAEGPAR